MITSFFHITFINHILSSTVPSSVFFWLTFFSYLSVTTVNTGLDGKLKTCYFFILMALAMSFWCAWRILYIVWHWITGSCDTAILLLNGLLFLLLVCHCLPCPTGMPCCFGSSPVYSRPNSMLFLSAYDWLHISVTLVFYHQAWFDGEKFNTIFLRIPSQFVIDIDSGLPAYFIQSLNLHTIALCPLLVLHT